MALMISCLYKKSHIPLLNDWKLFEHKKLSTFFTKENGKTKTFAIYLTLINPIKMIFIFHGKDKITE